MQQDFGLARAFVVIVDPVFIGVMTKISGRLSWYWSSIPSFFAREVLVNYSFPGVAMEEELSTSQLFGLLMG